MFKQDERIEITIKIIVIECLLRERILKINFIKGVNQNKLEDLKGYLPFSLSLKDFRRLSRSFFQNTGLSRTFKEAQTVC